jgi:hypothetical protein
MQDIAVMFILADVALSAVGKLGDKTCESLGYVYNNVAGLNAREFIDEVVPTVMNYINARVIN